jgi:hypothetical protein
MGIVSGDKMRIEQIKQIQADKSAEIPQSVVQFKLGATTFREGVSKMK